VSVPQGRRNPRGRRKPALHGAGRAEGALIGREAGGELVLEAIVEGLALIERILRGVDGGEEFDDDFAGLDADFAFFHDAMSAGTGDGHNGHSRFYGHDRSSLLEFLQAAVRAAGAFGINQKRLATTKSCGSFF